MVLLLWRVLKGLWWLVTLLPRLVAGLLRWLVRKLPQHLRFPVALMITLFIVMVMAVVGAIFLPPPQTPAVVRPTILAAPVPAPLAPIAQPAPAQTPSPPAVQPLPSPASPPPAPASPQTQPGMAEALRLGFSGVGRDLAQGLAALQAQLAAQAEQLRELAARTPATAPPPAALIPPPAVPAPAAPPQAPSQRAPSPQARPQEVIPADDPRNQAYMGGGAVTQPAGGVAQAESRGPGGIFGNKGRLSGQ